MQITFRPLRESDFPLLLRWLEMPHIKPWWTPEVSYTLDRVKEKYTPYISGYKPVKDASGHILQKPIAAYIIQLNDAPIGYIQLYKAYDFEHERKTKLVGLPQNLGAIDILIGEESYLGQGIGSRALQQFLNEYANAYFYIFVDPNPKNTGAIKAYTKVGFEKVLGNVPWDECWMMKRLQKVRLSDSEIEHIKISFKESFLKEDHLWLFGSRVDLEKKGGDIDFYVETYAHSAEEAIKMQANFLWKLENRIGEQKMDCVLNMLNFPYPLPIHTVAKETGVRII